MLLWNAAVQYIEHLLYDVDSSNSNESTYPQISSIDEFLFFPQMQYLLCGILYLYF